MYLIFLGAGSEMALLFYYLAVTYHSSIIHLPLLAVYFWSMDTLNTNFPTPGTIEDNLKSSGRIYRFNAECYRNTDKAILIWRDIWLPRSEIKITWGDQQVDCVNVKLCVPKWLIKKTLLDKKLKVD